MTPDIPEELDPGDGDPVLAFGPFVVELDAGRRIGFRLAYEPQQDGGTALRWDEAGFGARVHYLGDVDWVRAGGVLVSGQANGGRSALIRSVELRDLDGTPYGNGTLVEGVQALREDNRWAWSDA